MDFEKRKEEERRRTNDELDSQLGEAFSAVTKWMKKVCEKPMGKLVAKPKNECSLVPVKGKSIKEKDLTSRCNFLHPIIKEFLDALTNNFKEGGELEPVINFLVNSSADYGYVP